MRYHRRRSNRLFRSNDRIIGGVLAGFAEYYQIDKNLLRLGYLILSIFSAGFPGILIYVIAWIIIPERPRFY